MQVKRISLKDFRNYEKEIIDVHPGINVFFGDNAQGKTNILEAVYLCACARSHRTAKDRELIRQGNDAYRVELSFVDQQWINESLEIIYADVKASEMGKNRASRLVKHNGMNLSKIGDLMGLFHAVIFAPEDLMLVKEGPSTRRRFLDLLISQVKPTYFLHLQQYGRLLNQRNRLLKMLRDANIGRKTLDPQQGLMQLEVWDEALVKEGAAIVKQRNDYAIRISKKAEISQSEISSGKEKLSVKYKSIPGIVPKDSLMEIEKGYAEKLKSMINEDIERGITLYGPHRDDLDLRLDNESMRPYASQGQQRSAVLSLKLAELQILQEEIGETPVLLLDDVMSELDGMRRDSLLSYIKKAQVFVTCTDKSQVESVFNRGDDPSQEKRDIHFYEVIEGRVNPCDEEV